MKLSSGTPVSAMPVPKPGRRRALAGALLYLFLGTVWILGSDGLLGALVQDHTLLMRAQTLKGWAYVAFTAVLAWWLLQRDPALQRAHERTERELRSVVQNAGVGIVRASVSGHILSVNPKLCSILGYPEEAMLRMRLDALVLPEDMAAADRQRDAVLRGELDRYEAERRARAADGRVLTLLFNVSPVRDTDGVVTHVVTVVRDITEMRAAQVRLRMAATVIENTVEGVLVADADRCVLSVNPSFTRMFGYEEDEVRGRSTRFLRCESQDDAMYERMWAQVHSNGAWRGEMWSRRRNGEESSELMSLSAVRGDAGEITHYVAVFTDISLQKASQAQLDYLAHHDALTTLPNRLMFQLRLEQALAEAGRRGEQLAVLLLDLDRFKDVNDSFGHLTGDELLLQIATRLAARLRPTDLLARLGGDEFVLLLRPLGSAEEAADMARLCMQECLRPWRSGEGVELAVGTSVGISLFPEHGTTPAALLQGADAALYRAKADGRGVFRYFADEMTAAARGRLELEARLRRAVAQGELLLHYQPQVDIASGRIVGAEALLRWLDPEKGLVPPGHFIPVAEATGLIGVIGEWVLAEACRQGRAWLDEGLPALSLAVNLSPRQFLLCDVVGQVTQVLRASGFPADRLELEITEGVLVEREQDALETLGRLRALGVRIAVDDFGTGYSSLAKLKRFPLDVLKIDRSFISDIPASADDMAISSAIIAMARSLGLRVIAEGVETPAQLEFLLERCCDMYQGFLRSRPLPAAEFAALLRAQEHGIDMALYKK